MAFEKTLLQLRKKHGMSQLDLAEHLDVTRQTISRWETGSAFPSTQKLIALAQLFQIPLDELTGGTAAVPKAPEPPEEALQPEPEEKPKEPESRTARPFPARRLVIAVCALLLVVASLIGIYLFVVRGQRDPVPIEQTEQEEVDISNWGNIPFLPLEP